MKIKLELESPEMQVIANSVAVIAKQNPLGVLAKDLLKKINDAIKANKETENEQL